MIQRAVSDGPCAHGPVGSGGVRRRAVDRWLRRHAPADCHAPAKGKIAIGDFLALLRSGSLASGSGPSERGESAIDRSTSFQSCWAFFRDDARHRGCSACPAGGLQGRACFAVRSGATLPCPVPCLDCAYYQRVHAPQTRFIHRLDGPAAVVRERHFWDGNREWADLCGIARADLVGMALGELLHVDSLAALADRQGGPPAEGTAVSSARSVFIWYERQSRLPVVVWTCLLEDPPACRLLLAEPAEAIVPSRLSEWMHAPRGRD